MTAVNVTVSKSLWNTTAQFAHFSSACALMMAFRHHTSMRTSLILLALSLVAAGVKEFVYDRTQETSDERGSDLEDFCFYALGLAAGFFI